MSAVDLRARLEGLPTPAAYRETWGWSGPIAGSGSASEVEEGQRHSPVLARGRARVGDDRIAALHRRLERMAHGAPHLQAVRRSALADLKEAGLDYGRMRDLDPVVAEAYFEGRTAAARARVVRADERLAYVDRMLAAQRAADRSKALQEMASLRAALMAHRGVEEARALAQRIAIDDQAAHHRPLILDAATEFFRLVALPIDPNAIRVVGSEAERASAHPNGDIEIASSDRGELLHELAHIAEFNHPAIYEAAVDWRAARARQSHGEVRAARLAELAPGLGYEPDEMVIEDAFFSEYVGLTYEEEGLQTTEVFATGLERFETPATMLEFYRQDPEHFFFTVGALAP